jgi:AcrR family transcriptional regulator
MRKGDNTHQAILDRATSLASTLGLEGLTIGALASELELSKSGLFAHFRSKEALQIQVLEHGAAQFVQRVVRPSLAEPRGEPRMRALFERWLGWVRSSAMPGGCLFVQASTEFDDQPGPVRDRLADFQRQWRDVIATSFRKGIEAGAFRPDADPDQLAFEVSGVLLAYHHMSRLLQDPNAESRARTAFEAVLASARVSTP